MEESPIKQGMTLDERWDIGPFIGGGAFGVVYLARDRTDLRLFALKILRPEALKSAELVERFNREAEIMEQLNHRNTITLRYFGSAAVNGERLPYMVMELVRGLPTGRLLSARGTLEPDEAGSVLMQVLDSLHEAHMHGIIHRDLKPDNILVLAPECDWEPPRSGDELGTRLGVPTADDELWEDLFGLRVKVVDFGLGKLLEVGNRKVQRLTAVGVAAGTADYMSPEQVRGAPDIDHRSDQYGVAMLIHRFLTGRPTFGGNTMFEAAKRHLVDPLPPLPGALNDHPIARIYERGGAKDPAARYPSAADMAWDFRTALGLQDDWYAPTPGETPPSPKTKRGFFRTLFGRKR